MSFTELFIRRPVLSIVVSLMILLLGAPPSILLVGQIFRRDYSSFNYINNNRNTT